VLWCGAFTGQAPEVGPTVAPEGVVEFGTV
jgi:hypothetical protein